jgi:hypothetical protein
VKYFYIAVQINEHGKFYAYVIKVSESDNLLCKLRINYLVSANICKTRKAARDLVTIWNKQFKENGTYLFNDGPLF